MKIDEASRQWNVTPRRIQAMCAQGKLEGSIQIGREWFIPRSTPKPIDGLETFVIIVCVTAGVSLAGSGAFVTWFFIDRKKKS